MLHNLKKTLLFIGSSALLFTGCGDDGDTNNDTDAAVAVDATVTDAGVETDGMVDRTFGGTISLAEVAVTNPAAAAVPGGISGAAVNVSFTNPADETVAPEPGYTSALTGCAIYVYDVTANEEPAKGSDGGPVTVTGTAAGAFQCNYNAALDTYLCASTAAEASGALTAAGTSATPNGNGTVTVVLGGVDLDAFDPTGGSIIFDGFANAAMNTRLPVIAKPAANTIVVFNPALLAVTDLGGTDSTYATLVGTGPNPTGYDFLDNGTDELSIDKDVLGDVPAVAVTVKANGEGFALDGRSTLVHALPTDGSEAVFTCDEDDDPTMGTDTCGTDDNGILQALVLFGSTTDAPLPKSPAAFSVMPDPVSSYATFQCSALAGKSVKLDAGAMAIILGTNPTRIQTSVTYAAGELPGKNRVLVSHGVVGFTDVISANDQ